MKRIILLNILFFILISCSIKEKRKLESDSIITSVFNKTEIQDLQTILNFFNKQICENEDFDGQNINNYYQDFMKRLKSESIESNGTIYLEIPFEEQLKMYKRIENSTFNEIWLFGKSFPLGSSTDTLKSIFINHSGKYPKFLKEVGKKDSIINIYQEQLSNSGDISPQMFSSLLMGYENYNIKDIKVRLVIAIHYLTLNDENLRKEKY